MENFKITSIGLMSGTSLDGLDVCCTTFNRIDGKWTFHIDAARGYGPLPNSGALYDFRKLS